MIDAARVREPLDAAGPAIERLDRYETPEELAASVQAVWDAVERSLRLLLRGDAEAPDELRLAALQPDRLPVDRLIVELRRRDRISLELAGAAHELEAAEQRARADAVRAADADVALRVVRRLRAEIRSEAADPPARPADDLHVDSVAVAEEATAVPAAKRSRPWSVLAVVAVALIAVALALVLLLAREDARDQGIAAFRAGRYEVAEERFREALEDAPRDPTVLLFLGRVYRRQERSREAAEVLATAAAVAPEDADVQRELGHLFLDLGRASAAVQRYERALELDPDQDLNWIGLVRALRRLGDPRAETMLERAPASVQAALSRTTESPDPDS